MILDRHWQKLKAAQPKLVNDLPSDISLSDNDVNTIATALDKSNWLRINIRSLYKLYKWLPRLVAGYYDDYKVYDEETESRNAEIIEETMKIMTVYTEED